MPGRSTSDDHLPDKHPVVVLGGEVVAAAVTTMAFSRGLGVGDKGGVWDPPFVFVDQHTVGPASLTGPYSS